MIAVGTPTRDRALPAADRDGTTVRVWDNANIVESFSGVTLPLTYSVAREAYATVYRNACRSLGVSSATLDAEADVFEQMIGHIEGRVYYNVTSWHRVLALLPGFGANQALLERMMGASRPGAGAGERAEPVVAASPDICGLLRFAMRSGAAMLLFERRARAFERMIRRLGSRSRARDVESMSIEQLLDHFDEVRRRALAGWHVTIANDLAVMVIHGTLRRTADRWLAPGAGPILNRLLRTGALASTAPAVELRALAECLRRQPTWLNALDRGDDPLAQLRSEPALAELRVRFDRYIDRWGDRCPSELQLDRASFREDPRPVLSIVRAMASAPADEMPIEIEVERAAAWQALRAACVAGTGPGRAARLRVLRALVDMTRYCLAWRERMRFARTEVFAIGRRIFRAMDLRFVETGILERPGDLHYLDRAELRGAIRGTLPPVDLRVIVADRRARFERYRVEATLPSRLETSGPVLFASNANPIEGDAPTAEGETLSGTGVCPGIVRGRCLPVDDPRGVTPRPGDIVAARSTDPGWVPLLMAASGLLVERGSLLSHSAIVARELGLPTIVAIDGLMARIGPGQVVQMDGSTGLVVLESTPAGPSAKQEQRT